MVQKSGQQCRLVIRLLAMTITVLTTVHHMEHTRQAMTTLATMIIRHITASHLLTGVVMPQLQPAMHRHILVCYTYQYRLCKIDTVTRYIIKQILMIKNCNHFI